MSTRLVHRAVALGRREGLHSLLTAFVRQYLVDYRIFLLYEYDLQCDACLRLPPLPEEFEERFVTNNSEADSLAREREDFRDLVPSARRALDAGGVALCIYHGTEVAHIGWIATSQPARRALDPLPFTIPFDKGGSWAGAVYTLPLFRNRGLLKHSALRRFAWLRDSGIDVCRSAVEADNEASKRVQSHFDPSVYGVGHMTKLLRWRIWRERRACSQEPPGY